MIFGVRIRDHFAEVNKMVKNETYNNSNRSVYNSPCKNILFVFKRDIKEGVKTMAIKAKVLPCPGSKIRSKGAGRGLGRGNAKGPIGVPYKAKVKKK